MMSTPVTSNCYGAQLYNRVNVMMLNPVALNCHGAQPYNRVNVMMSNPVTSKRVMENNFIMG